MKLFNEEFFFSEKDIYETLAINQEYVVVFVVI